MHGASSRWSGEIRSDLNVPVPPDFLVGVAQHDLGAQALGAPLKHLRPGCSQSADGTPSAKRLPYEQGQMQVSKGFLIARAAARASHLAGVVVGGVVDREVGVVGICTGPPVCLDTSKVYSDGRAADAVSGTLTGGEEVAHKGGAPQAVFAHDQDLHVPAHHGIHRIHARVSSVHAGGAAGHAVQWAHVAHCTG